MLKPGHVVDMYDDADGTFLRDGELLKKFGDLHITPTAEIGDIPDRDYALIVLTKTGERHRKYPMDTPDSLAISTHYFEKVGSQLPEEARHIAGTNLYHGHLKFGAEPPSFLADLKADVDGNLVSEMEVGHKIEEEEKKAFSKFALQKTLMSGAKLEAFPVDTLEATRESVINFKKCAAELPGRERIMAASRLLQSLSGFGQADESLAKIAACDRNPAFSAHVQTRRDALTSDEESLNTLNELEKNADQFVGPLLGAALEEFDMRSGLSRYWGRGIENPWDSCFHMKTASIKVGGKTITKEALLKLADSGKLATIFGEKTVEMFKKQPMEIFQSLPAPTKETISNLIE